jgi:hypothetical protein
METMATSKHFDFEIIGLDQTGEADATTYGPLCNKIDDWKSHSWAHVYILKCLVFDWFKLWRRFK